MRRTIRAEYIAFIKKITVERNRLGDELVSKLEEAIRKSIAIVVLAASVVLGYFFDAKHGCCVIIFKGHASK